MKKAILNLLGYKKYVVVIQADHPSLKMCDLIKEMFGADYIFIIPSENNPGIKVFYA